MKNITLQEIFTSLTYHSAEFTLLKTLIWVLIAIITVFIFYFIYSKILFKTSKTKEVIKSDTRLSLSLLWAIVSFMVLFSILICILLYYIDFNSIDWTNYQTYLAFFKNQSYSLFPYIICYLGVIIFYYFRISKFKNKLKTL